MGIPGVGIHEIGINEGEEELKETLQSTMLPRSVLRVWIVIYQCVHTAGLVILAPPGKSNPLSVYIEISFCVSPTLCLSI